MSKQLRELQARKSDLVKEARALTDIAAQENRDLTDVWPLERTCRDLAGLEILMGFRRQTSFSQPTQS